jgi:hypothetical protein
MDYRAVFGESGRYVETAPCGPNQVVEIISGRPHWKLAASFVNKRPNYTAPTMLRVGNIQHCWHGTSGGNLEHISNEGMVPSFVLTKRNREPRFYSSAFGPGIYTSPKVAKAWAYMNANNDYQVGALLYCRVALGNPFHAPTTGDWRDKMGEYHSVIANAGTSVGGYYGKNGTSVPHTEWVVFDIQQCVVDEVHLYRIVGPTEKEKKEAEEELDSTPLKKRKTKHPCYIGHALCKYAYCTGVSYRSSVAEYGCLKRKLKNVTDAERVCKYFT